MKKMQLTFGTVENICSKGNTMLPVQTAIEAYERFEQDSELSEICTVDSRDCFYGILTRHRLMEKFGGMYGYNLHKNAKICDVMSTDTMIVESDCAIEYVAEWAMEREKSKLYDAVVVLKDNRYMGIVTIKKLLTTAISIQVKRAWETNPLTKLPGNQMVESQIKSLVGEKKPYGIMYLDLDNFKAYNDAYGFHNGDRMISTLVRAMKEACSNSDFIGHIGGDDFVIITRTKKAHEIGEKIIEYFKSNLKNLYNETDWGRGYIISKNRNGLTENFPMASVSIAIVTNEKDCDKTIKDLSKRIVKAKKQAKQTKGNSIVVL